ncbi:PAS domain S-box protein [candidate division WOR-3 bacterium]|nr:PAS domain S-box protein [candidate division WOR-3 bacterium]
MSKASILVVEDISVTALDIKNRLLEYGYSVCGVVTSGEEALLETERLRPDLVLMDIILQGKIDGVEAAEKIKEELNIPVVYLTAHMDNATLDRARLTEPFGYIVKPFETREMVSTLELALYRHKIERALKESEERYRSLHSNVPVGVFRSTPSGEVLSANPAMVRMMGYDSEDEYKTVSIPDLYLYPQQRDRFVKRLKDDGAITEFEVQLRRKNQTVFWASLTAKAVSDNEGKIVHYDGILEDISERKQRELRGQIRTQLLDKLRGAETIQGCLQLGCEAVRDAGLFKRAVFTTKNEKGETTNAGYVGVDRQIVEELRKKPPATREMYARMLKEDFKISHSYFLPVEAGLDISQTGRYVLQDVSSGEGPDAWQRGDELLVPMFSMSGLVESWLSVDTPVDGKRPDEATINYLEDIVDIVARQIREIKNITALRESEERYRSLTERASAGVYIFGPQDRFIFANPAMEKITGYSRKELIHMNPWDIVVPEDKEGVLKDRSQARVKGEELESSYRMRVIRKNGEEATLEIKATPITYEGKPAQLGHCIDITESIKNEKKIEHLNSVLRAIRNVNQLISHERVPEKLLEGICSKLVETRSFYSAWVVLVDDSGKVAFIAEAGLKDKFAPILKPLKQGRLTDCGLKALECDDIIVIDDPANLCRDCHILSGEIESGMMYTRLKYAEKIFGVLAVSLSSELSRETEEQELFCEVGGDIAFALYSIEADEKRRQAEEALEREHRAFKIIAEASVQAKDIADLCKRVLEGLVKALVFDVGTFRLYDADHKLLKLWASFGLSEEEIKDASGAQPLNDPRYVAALTARTSEPIIAPDIYRTERLQPFISRLEKFEERSLISWPILDGRQGLLGVLQLWSKKEVDISEGDRTFFERVAGMFATVLERKRTEEELDRQHQKIEALFDNVDVLLWSMREGEDGELYYEQVNSAFAAVEGYSPDYYNEKTISELHPREQCNGIMNTYAWVKNDGMHVNDVHYKGRHFVMRFFPLKDFDGRIRGFIGSGIDITDRKRAEEGIKSRLFYEESVSHCSQILVEMVDLGEALQQVTDEMLSVGKASRAFIFKNLDGPQDVIFSRLINEAVADGVEPQITDTRFQHLVLQEASQELFQKLSSGRPYGGSVKELPSEDRTALFSPETRSVLILPILIEDKFWGFIGFEDQVKERKWTQEDIQLLRTLGSLIGSTIERRRAEEGLRESEERYRAFTEEALVGVYIYRERRFLFVNRAMEEITGYSREELLAMDTGKLVIAEDQAMLTARSEARERGEEVPSQYSMRIERKNGQIAVLEVRTRQIVFAGQKAYLGNCVDITEIRRVQEALEKSEERYRVLTEEAMVGIYLTVGKNFVFLNPAMEKITGYTRNELLKIDMHSIVVSEDVEMITERKKQRKPGQPDQYTMRIKRKTGEIATLEVRVRPIPYQDKAAFLGNCVDITEIINNRKQIEQAKRAWESTFDSISDLVMILDTEYRIIRANRAVKEYTGIDFNDLLGRNYLDVYNLNEEDKGMKEILGRKAKLPEHFEIKDSVRGRMFSVSVSPLIDPVGEIIATVHVARDISDMRMMEEALAESEAQFRGLAESAMDIIFSVELDGMISYVNPSVEEILGVNPAVFIGSNLGSMKDSRLFTAEVRKVLSRNLSSNLEEKDIPFFEIETEDVKGRKHVIEVSARRLFHRIVGIARDVTERNLMQQQLIKASKLASIGVLAAGIAHQVNNPLAILLVHSTLLRTIFTDREEIPLEVKEEVSEYLDTMEEQVERTRRVVSGLLEFTQPERSEPKPTDVNPIVNQAAKWLSQRYSLEELTLELFLDKALPRAFLDKVALEQVIMNVIENAYDAMEGSGKLSIETMLVNQSTVSIRISDTGPGVPSEIRDEIFEPLYTTKSGKKGTGLGLSLASMLLERFGGRIYLADTKNEGASFVIEVPVYQDKVDES